MYPAFLSQEETSQYPNSFFTLQGRKKTYMSLHCLTCGGCSIEKSSKLLLKSLSVSYVAILGHFYLFIYLFVCLFVYFWLCWGFISVWGKRGPLFIAVRGPLTIAASLVAEHRLQTRRLSSRGSRAQLLRGMWDLPRPGLEPVSPALAGRLSPTAPPGQPHPGAFWKPHWVTERILLKKKSSRYCYKAVLQYSWQSLYERLITYYKSHSVFLFPLCVFLFPLCVFKIFLQPHTTSQLPSLTAKLVIHLTFTVLQGCLAIFYIFLYILDYPVKMRPISYLIIT